MIYQKIFLTELVISLNPNSSEFEITRDRATTRPWLMLLSPSRVPMRASAAAPRSYSSLTMNFKLGSHHGATAADEEEEGTNRVRCGGWEDHYQGYGD